MNYLLVSRLNEYIMSLWQYVCCVKLEGTLDFITTVKVLSCSVTIVL